MRNCIDVWYERAGQEQKLPNLPGWIVSDTACAKRFIEEGGYGEMTVFGTSVDCDPVNDGNGAAYVFARTTYCGSDCAKTPDSEACKRCSVSGSGDF